jgi:hypothetical protein
MYLEVLSPQTTKRLDLQIANSQMHICGRSANLTAYSSPWRGGGGRGVSQFSLNLIETTNESISGIDITIPNTVQGFTRSLMLTSVY